MWLSVRRILGLAGEVLPVELSPGPEPQHGNRPVPLPVLHQLLYGLDTLTYNVVITIKPGDLKHNHFF